MVRIVNEAARQHSFPSRSNFRSAKAMESGEVVHGGWMSVLTPVNKGVYAKQYENKDTEVQTTYT